LNDPVTGPFPFGGTTLPGRCFEPAIDSYAWPFHRNRTTAGRCVELQTMLTKMESVIVGFSPSRVAIAGV
jgi:hypothetical protein